jgi:hypothetical protein
LPPLPPGWRTAINTESGRPYYYQEGNTTSSSWNLPSGMYIGPSARRRKNRKTRKSRRENTGLSPNSTTPPLTTAYAQRYITNLSGTQNTTAYEKKTELLTLKYEKKVQEDPTISEEDLMEYLEEQRNEINTYGRVKIMQELIKIKQELQTKGKLFTMGVRPQTRRRKNRKSKSRRNRRN